MPNLFQQLLSGVSNVASRASDRMLPAPAGGLFDPKDIEAARRQGMLHLGLSLLGDTSGLGLGHALQQGVGQAQDAYSGSLNTTSTQGTALRQKQMLANRQAIMQKYAPAPGEDASAMMKKFPLMMGDLMRIGDTEGAKSLEGIVSRMAELQSQPNKLQTVQLGDRVVTFDPEKGIYKNADGTPTTDLTRHENPDEKMDHALSRALQQEQIQTQRVLREQAQAQTAGAAFMRQNKGLVDSEPMFQNWDAAYRDAKAGNPAAYKSAIVNFSSIADPKAQIRLGVLQFISKVDPSLVGQAQIALQRSKDGTFPQEILDKMNEHVKEIHRGAIKVYNTRREARVKANPMLDQYIDPVESIFPSSTEQMQTGSTAPSESRIGQFLNGFGGKK
jgi:hypothetical protein